VVGRHPTSHYAASRSVVTVTGRGAEPSSPFICLRSRAKEIVTLFFTRGRRLEVTRTISSSLHPGKRPPRAFPRMQARRALLHPRGLAPQVVHASKRGQLLPMSLATSLTRLPNAPFVVQSFIRETTRSTGLACRWPSGLSHCHVGLGPLASDPTAEGSKAEDLVPSQIRACR
jgi:hypothetical protein